MNCKSAILMLSLCLALSGCTRPGETTAAGAAAGGVLGAGLGAIVGNQTGDPGSGMVIGALAGASAGAAVGNALQAQQESIRTQDEALERQERTIRAQNAELQELRGIRASSSDSVSFGRSSNGSSAGLADRSGSRALVEKSLIGGPAEVRGSINWEAQSANAGSGSALRERSLNTEGDVRTGLDTSADVQMSTECRAGFDEALTAKKSADKSERLFHYRRALRLCPSEPAFHNGLGEVYLSLNRKADAEFEFREALKLDPEFATARRNMQAIEK